MKKFFFGIFAIISTCCHANADDSGIVIHCKYVGDTDCVIENKPQKITETQDCNLIPKTFDNDTVLYIGRNANGDLACSNELYRATHSKNSVCPHIRLFYQDDTESMFLFCVTNKSIKITYDEGDPENFSYAHKQCIGSNGIWKDGKCDCSALNGTKLVNNECLCTENSKQKYYNPMLTGCETMADGVKMVLGGGSAYMMGDEKEGMSKYDRVNSCDITGGNYEGALGDPSLPNKCDCTKAPNMKLDPTGYFCECIPGYNYADPSSKYQGCVPDTEIDHNALDIPDDTDTTNESYDETAFLDTEDIADETTEEDEEEENQDLLSQIDSDQIADKITDLIPNSISQKNENKKDDIQKEKSRLEQAEDILKDAKENEQSFANRMLGGATTAATGLGMMTAASARAEQRADADAEQDMNAYLATFKCEYGRGMSAKAGNEEITLPGGNELVAYYSEYKQLADSLKNTKKALGLRPGIEEEIVYDKAETGLYKYASTGITSGAYTSLSRALTDEDGADAAAWNAQKEETAKKLKTGVIAAGAGIVGGVVGNYLINGHREKTELQKKIDKVVQEVEEQVPEYIVPEPEEEEVLPKFEAPVYERQELKEEPTQLIMPERKEIPQIAQLKPRHLNLSGDNTFATGKSTIKDPTALEALIKRLDDTVSILNDQQKICISITGHTDRTQYQAGSKMTNQKLSEQRAQAVQKYLKDGLVTYGDKINYTSIVGEAEKQCTKDKYPKSNDPNCRRVDIEIVDCSEPTGQE